jgi:hypothetical protein
LESISFLSRLCITLALILGGISINDKRIL